MKVTYGEGKLEWSRKIVPYNLLDSNSFVIYNSNEFMANPRNSEQFMMNALFGWNNAYYYGGNIMLRDNGTHLLTDFH